MESDLQDAVTGVVGDTISAASPNLYADFRQIRGAFGSCSDESQDQEKQDRPRILAADDQQHILEALELLLRPQGYEVETARSRLWFATRSPQESYDAC